MMDELLHLKLDLIAKEVGAYQVEQIAIIMKRQFHRRDGEQATVIDFFPPWNRAGTWPALKLCHEYMDFDWQIDRFEQFSGLDFSALPVLESERAVRRRYGFPNSAEVPVKTPFSLMVVSPKKEDGGDDKKKLIVRYVASIKTNGNGKKEQPKAKKQDAKSIYWGTLTPGEGQAYRDTNITEFSQHVALIITRWNEINVRQAILAILGGAVMYPAQANFEHGKERVNLFRSLMHLSSLLDDGVTQVESLEITKRFLKGLKEQENDN